MNAKCVGLRLLFAGGICMMPGCRGSLGLDDLSFDGIPDDASIGVLDAPESEVAATDQSSPYPRGDGSIEANADTSARGDTASFDAGLDDASGLSCTELDDCSNPAQVCDVATGKCVASQCVMDWDCGKNHRCIRRNLQAGACVSLCSAVDPKSCPTGQICSPWEDGTGYCQRPDTVKAGQSCSAGLLSTGCESGFLCLDDVCRKACAFWSEGPTGCKASEWCRIGGVCDSNVGGDAASLGELCQEADTWCAGIGGRYQGVCTEQAGGLICQKLCRFRQPTDCESDQICSELLVEGEVWSGWVGVCKDRVAGTPPASCRLDYDCSAAGGYVCIADGTCYQGRQCAGFDTDCQQGELCEWGICYKGCAPFTSNTGCAAGQQCTIVRGQEYGDRGICLPLGPAREDAACEFTNISTGCAQGLQCGTQSGASMCLRYCNYWATSADCPTDRQCDGDFACHAPPKIDTAVDQTCMVSDEDCGTSVHRVEGKCIDSGDGPICRKRCRDSTDCPADKECMDSEGDNVWTYCMPR